MVSDLFYDPDMADEDFREIIVKALPPCSGCFALVNFNTCKCQAFKFCGITCQVQWYTSCEAKYLPLRI